MIAPSFRPVPAVDVSEAERFAAELDPGVVVVDACSGGRRADEIVRRLRSRRELETIPILVLVEAGDDEARGRLLREGAWDYLTSPHSADDLLFRIGRLLAEAAAKGAEARLSTLVEQAPEGVFVSDLRGRFTDVNRTGLAMLGLSRDEIVGRSIEEFIPPGQVDRLWREREALLRGDVVVSEWAARRKDGSWIPVEVSAKILPDGRWQACLRDITHRKRMETELRLSQERFQLALRGANLAAWDWNVQTGEVVYSARWAEMRGFRLEEVRPHVDTWKAGVHPDDWPRVDGILQRCLRGDDPEFESVHRVITRTGGELVLLDRGKVFVRDESGRPVRMVGVELDITERKRAEDEQRILAEAGSTLAASLDVREILAGIARLVVREFADFFLVDLTEPGGEVRLRTVESRDPSKRWICDLLLGSRIDRTRSRPERSVLRTRQPTLIAFPTEEEIAALAQNQEHLRALRAAEIRSIIAVPMTARGELLGVLTFLSFSPTRAYDRTDLRLAEEIARRTAIAVQNARLYRSAQRALRARDDVLAIVAHDLRNPLGTILATSTLLARRGVETGAIERSALRMNRLIQDLLDVTRIESGGLALRRERESAERIVADAVEAQRTLTESSSLEVEVALGRDLPALWADRDRLLQVFENLLGNAVKFTGPGGRITVGAKAGDGEVEFRVADTGCGIAPTDVPRLFDRFWQAERPERRGAGLGLPIVKGIVERHGGRVWVESAPGRGSTFFFTIPTAPGGERRAPEPLPAERKEGIPEADAKPLDETARTL